jgi:hypothetical protein
MLEEIYIWAFVYFFICLTDFVEDLYTQESVGFFMIIYVSIFLAVSLLIFVGHTIYEFYRQSKKWLMLKKHKKAQLTKRNQVRPAPSTERQPIALTSRTIAEPEDTLKVESYNEDSENCANPALRKS